MSSFPDWLQFVLAPQMFNGLSIGVAVILMALGLTIIFGLLDVINMAHGEFYAMGAYAGLTLAAMGISFWLLLVIVPLLMAALGYAVERSLIQRVFHHKDRHILTLLLTFGLAIVLEDVYKLIYGPQSIKPETPIEGATEVLGMFFPKYRLFLIAFGAAIITAVWLVVYRTRLGAMVRVYAGTFAFGVALAGLSGVLLAPLYSMFPTMGKDFILMAFSVVIVGGLGSIKGAVLAGLILTQIQTISSLYISPSWTDPLVFGIMVLVLMVRPQGMFGRLGHA
jgi:branched-chain amino acid transport system permease protein